jgi:two-component system chemotaxis response regulator CheB
VCRLDDGVPENFCRPSVDPMLRAVVRMHGGRALAVILTGMGQDGLAGCRALVEAGGAVLAQDEATSVVWGMPGAVAQAGICHAVLPLDRIGDGIAAIANGTSAHGALRHTTGTRGTS